MNFINPFRNFVRRSFHGIVGDPVRSKRREIRRQQLASQQREILLRRVASRPRLLAGSPAKRIKGEVFI
jgi:hypothetical protein